MDKLTPEEFAAEWASNPRGKQLRHKFKQELVSGMIDQAEEFSHISITARRNGCTVTVTWRLKGSAANSVVDVFIYDIGLFPDANVDFSPQNPPHHSGDGVMTIKCEEGSSALLLLVSTNDKEIHTARIVISVPLSVENRNLLKRAIEAKEGGAAAVEDAMNTYLEKQEAFDETLRSGIERIKAKKLSPEEEERQIEDFRDTSERLKEKFGI